jgi:predicted component of viral defense system (DUF524 family)
VLALRKGLGSSLVLRKESKEVQLIYNRRFLAKKSSVTHDMKPDICVVVSTGDSRKLYIFDAKYKKGSDGGPKEEDIDKMHTYRDGIGHFKEDGSTDREFLRDVEGAYVLFPSTKEDYMTHRYYKSLRHGIGGIPLIPGETEYLKDMLSELCNGGD